MLRVAAAVRAELGREPLGALVAAYGHSYWDQPKGSGMRAKLSTTAHAEEVLAAAGLAISYAAALDDTSWTNSSTRRPSWPCPVPVGMWARPSSRSSLPMACRSSGPVISRVPADEDAVPLWNAVTTLAAFPGFAEMKRSMREVPQLNILGASSDAPQQEDWKGGHRAGHLASDRATAGDKG